MIHFLSPLPAMSATNNMRPLMMMAFALGLATAVPVLVLVTG